MSQKHGNTANGTTNKQSVQDDRTVPPMGWTESQFQSAAQSSIDAITQYYSTITSRPVLPSISPGYLQNLLPEAPPSQGVPWKDIEADIEKCIMPGVTHWQHPKFMAFFPASTTYPTMLGELWSAALSAPAFNWICSPVVTELETIVVDWMAKMLNLPETFLSKGEGGGVIQLSASDAIATVMVTARERWIRRQLAREGVTGEEEIEDRSCELRGKLVALGSDQAHSSTKKGATIAGTRFRTIRTHRAHAYGLRADEVRTKIEELKAKGLQPYYLTVTIGTTSTCAVDDLEGIAEVCKDYPDIWIHCDGAYAGNALALPEYQHLSKQLSFVDSFNPNMHKWMMVNFDAALLFVQKRRDLTDTLSITPAYLKNEFTDSGLVTDYRDWQIPLGRRFRALKIWFVIRTFGVEGFQAYLRYGINLGNFFVDLVRSRDDLFSIFTPPAFGLVVFTVNPRKRHRPQLEAAGNGADPRPYQDMEKVVQPDVNDAELKEANEVTKEVFEIVEQQREFMITSTIVDGVFAIRIISANPLAEEKYVRQIFGQFCAAAEEVLRKRGNAAQANGST